MAANDDEEERLRSVALQNARSILLARQRAEEALRKQSEWLRITLSSIGDAVISTDAEVRVTFLNGVAESLTGWPQVEAIGRPLPEVFKIVNELTREPVENPALRALREGAIVGLANHTVLIARDGTERPIDDSASPIRDDSGAPVGAVLVFRDVTERKRAEEAKARLAAIVESSEDAIVSKTLDGIVTSWNAGAERLFGYTAAEAVGKPITLIIPPDRRHEERLILERLRRGERIEHYETVRQSKQGSLINISLTTSPVRDGTGRIIGASKVARDITARVKAEEALREADRRKDEFLATLAHELRNPLAPIRSSVQVLKQLGPPEPQLQWARDVIERQVGQMTRLVDDILDVSRISRGKAVLRKEVVDLASVVSRAVDATRPLIEERRHKLTVSLPAETTRLQADPARLEQILVNLLTNAAKYSEPGGRIWVTAEREHDAVAVRVRDTGIGMTADFVARAFEMFTQAEQGTDRARGGLGIGLSLVRTLTEMHGGSVTAHSPGLNQGSEFTVRLPLGAEERTAGEKAPGDATKQRAQGPGRRILVVDDNKDAAQSLAMLLRLMGNDVHTSYDGPSALEAADAYRPDLVLMDIGLPGMSGHDVARCLRKQPGLEKVMLVAVTGWGQEEDRRLSREAGFDSHMVKPIDFDALQKLLASHKPVAVS